uniref:ILEI/PANDER domain-containing protein n=1 Tax=Branchiostoma floridae TaxID=7739 RepID=C3ZMK8_BRAFL|eukprot:XP_002590207.1 hypothetical protein BRAFLDRAFT_97430 [Branchiostoma floridae]
MAKLAALFIKIDSEIRVRIGTLAIFTAFLPVSRPQDRRAGTSPTFTMVNVILESGGAQDPLPQGKTNWMGQNGPGGWCSIKVNNVEQGLNSIGFNIVVLKFPEQNPPEQYSCFDTCKDQNACFTLADFIQKIQPDRYILMSACGSITDCLCQPLCGLFVCLFVYHLLNPLQDRYILMSACGSITDCLCQPLCDELRALGSGYFSRSMDELSGAHRNESWVMVARKGHGLIKECFKPAGQGPCIDSVDI